MKNTVLVEDRKRRKNGKLPLFQTFFRKYQGAHCLPVKYFYLIIFLILRKINHVELPADLNVGPGLFLDIPIVLLLIQMLLLETM